MTALEHWRSLAPSPRPLSGGDTYHVFLSYRSVNRPWVINLYDVLQAHGYEVFLDQVRLSERFPRALRPQQLRALALVRRGGTDDLGEAQALLSAAYDHLPDPDPLAP